MKSQKQQTAEKVVMVICIIVIILLAKGFMNKQMRIDEMKKAHVDSLEKVALKVDSLEKIVAVYEISGAYWDVEVTANSRDFTDYFKRNFTDDSLQKVVIVATPDKGDSLCWHIKVKNPLIIHSIENMKLITKYTLIIGGG